ncbi:MAG TPA: trypsin-like peptidase domain-containing protein [Candidatus Limnocylindria bacterium]|nr:trypsin-like peptidase domain-containing protein [Candidatus Limnocylindria bacterium]
MKYGQRTAIVCSIGLLGAACGQSGHELDIEYDPESIAAEYKELPAEVLGATGSTVLVGVKVENPESTAAPGSVQIDGASGVVVEQHGKKLILTARHVLETVDLTCQSGVVAVDLNPDPELVEPYAGYIERFYTEEGEHDLAIIEPTAAFAEKLETIPAVPLLSEEELEQQGKVGQAVFFSNYEVLPGAAHTPFAAPANEGYPSVFAGMLIDQTQSGNAVVVDGIRGYGHTEMSVLADRASGGPVVFPGGTLFGLSILREPESLNEDEIRRDYDTKVPDGEYSIGYVEPVWEKQVEALVKGLEAERACPD